MDYMKTDTVDFADGSKTVYYYDNNDREMRVEEMDQSGNVIMSVEREYNSAGKCSGWVVNNASGVLIKRFEVGFDEDGNVLETRQFDNQGNLEHILSPNVGSLDQ